MSGAGKTSAQCGVTLPSLQADYLTARGAALDWSQSKTLKAIVQFWFALGAPPLSEPDAKAGITPLDHKLRVVPLECWLPYLPRPSGPAHAPRLVR